MSIDHALDGEELALRFLRTATRHRVDFSREGVKDTPLRMVRALRELTEGYEQDPFELLGRTFPRDGYDQVVAVRALPFVSLCEHHVLPFTGTVSVAYLPGERIVGLSKIPRTVRALSRRLQVQERLTKPIADVLDQALEPRGVAVIVRALHSCMALRGIESTGEMVTSDVRGVFRNDASARAEVLEVLR
jgi:GTP cyclohydrolase IA